MTSETPDFVQREGVPANVPTKVARLRLNRRTTDDAESATTGRVGWTTLRRLRIDHASAARHLLYIDGEMNESVARFDLLRTMLTGTMEEHGLRRLAVAAPTAGCGTSYVAANLALSMARRPSARVMLADFNLRAPGLARQFGTTAPGPIAEVLTGGRDAIAHLRVHGDNLAVMMNSKPVPNSAELLQEPSLARTLRGLRAHLAPSIEIYDMPPLLGSDETLSFLPQVDGLLLVADGTRTTASDIAEAEALINGRTELVGLVLNRGEIGRSMTDMLRGIGGRWFGRGRKG